MSRPLKQQFNCEPLEQLTRQLLFAPPEKRALQVQRAEKLHDELEPNQTYPLDFIIYRLTSYRRDVSDSTLLVGEAAQPDLRLMIDRLSRSIRLPKDDGEPAETAAQLAARLNVSTQTITRWRQRGLRWRWVVAKNGARGAAARQVVFPRSAVDRFVRQNGERVKRASQFTQIPATRRRDILHRARRIAEAREVTLNQVAQHLARRTGRALETLRLILEKHDRQHPKQAIFAGRTAPLSARQKRMIERAHRWGVSAEQMAERFKRSRATIYRVIRERRAAAARRVDVSFVPSPIFDREDADAVILRDEVVVKDSGGRAATAVNDLPEALQPLYRQPAVNDRRQRSMFVRYNYLKFKAARVRDALDPYEPRTSDLDTFDGLLAEARALRSQLARINLPVVLSVARRHVLGQREASAQALLGLLEQGHAVLFEVIESFNAARTPTFASYLTNKLLQRFAAADTENHHARRRAGGDELLRRLVKQAYEKEIDLNGENTGASSGAPGEITSR